MLANVGVTWYTWLEQGRNISVSAEILAAVGEALRLEGAELEHLYTLAGKVPPRVGEADAQIHRNAQRLLSSTQEVPGYIADRYWNVLGVNDLAYYIFDVSTESNCLVKFFTDLEYASHYPFQEAAGAMMVTQFRRQAAAYPADKAFDLLAKELADSSKRFAEIWSRQEMSHAPHLQVAFDHDVVGRLTFDSVVMTPVAAGDLMFFILSAASRDRYCAEETVVTLLARIVHGAAA